VADAQAHHGEQPPSRIRAGITKIVLAHRARLSEDERATVEAQVGLDWIAAVERRFNTAYLPSAEHIQLLDAIVRAAGKGSTRQFFRDAYLSGFSTFPMLRTLIAGTLRTFGTSPGRLAKVMPRAWEGLCDRTGRFAADVDFEKCVARLTYSELPAELSASGSWAHSFAGVFDGFIEQCSTTGTVQMEDVDLKHGRANFVIAWNE